MVSHAVYKCDTAGIYGAAKSRVAEVPATVRLWGVVGIPLDIVLRQYQGLECLYWCDLFLADWLLHGSLRANDLQTKVLLARTAVFADYRRWCIVHLLA